MNYLLLLIPIGMIVLFIYCTVSLSNQSKKDWATLDYLKAKANDVKTKEEIETFYKEFQEKASKINNKFINPKLYEIDGYLRGVYQQFKTTNQ